MKTEAIVASAGIGKRLTQLFHARAGLKTEIRKPYLNLLGKPILVHTLQALSNSKEINSIIVVVNRLDKERCNHLIKKYNIKKIKTIIIGGKYRFNSVYNGLKAVDNDTDIVVIHDGVRPFIYDDIIKRSVACAKRFGACVVGVPVKATIKKLTSSRASYLDWNSLRGKTVEKTVDRTNLWEIQTPQVFKKDLILKAYKKFGSRTATDDAVVAEKLGIKVKVVFGSYNNIKITTPEDLVIAEAIAKYAHRDRL
ncbi:MAG: 2-C-methyl-D-erythritol 4-phosphate cytidylyltransferase [Candidatus Omnitrophica bacterium]|nr:2-C-methyl-D-erythritol 4-phosphate cytidylyltransferase [Candidatus Omnitrophota bacterium]